MEQIITLVPQAYEWLCPSCGAHHSQATVTERVRCRTCGLVFATELGDHVIGSVSEHMEAVDGSHSH